MKIFVKVAGMDIQQLKYFVEVAKEKNLTKAAKKLFLSQPALSKMIRKLEEELGLELFERQNKKIRLTDIGENLFESAKKAIFQFDDIEKSLQDTVHLKKGHIIVGIPPVIGSLYFAPIISGYKNNFPGVDFSLFEEGARTVATQVSEGTIDIGVVISPVDSGELTGIPVMKDVNAVIVHKDNPLANKASVSFSDLKDEAFCIFNKHFLLHEQITDQCHKAGFKPEIIFESSQWDFIIEMIALNQGISILPRPIIARTVYTDIRIIPLEPVFPWEITIIIKKGKYVSFAMKEFINHVKRYFN